MLHGSNDVPGSFYAGIRAVENCVQETCTRKNLYKIDWHTCKFIVQDDLHKFLEVFWACVAGIRKILGVLQQSVV